MFNIFLGTNLLHFILQPLFFVHFSFSLFFVNPCLPLSTQFSSFPFSFYRNCFTCSVNTATVCWYCLHFYILSVTDNSAVMYYHCFLYFHLHQLVEIFTILCTEFLFVLFYSLFCLQDLYLGKQNLNVT